MANLMLLAHVVGTASLDNGVLDLILIQVGLVGRAKLIRELLPNGLQGGTVHGHAGLLHDWGIIWSPGNKHKLGALALFVTSGEAEIAIGAVTAGELGDEILPTTSTSLTNNDGVVVRVASDSPNGVVAIRANSLVSFAESAIVNVGHGGIKGKTMRAHTV